MMVAISKTRGTRGPSFEASWRWSIRYRLAPRSRSTIRRQHSVILTTCASSAHVTSVKNEPYMNRSRSNGDMTPVGPAITVEKIDRVLTDVQAQIEHLRVSSTPWCPFPEPSDTKVPRRQSQFYSSISEHFSRQKGGSTRSPDRDVESLKASLPLCCSV
jgi:hypothetical protein